jgi:ABC-type multidrug transport system fused ATPase/permease subunit
VTTAAGPVPYAENAARHERARDLEAQRSERISRLRLGAFLTGVAALAWMWSRGPGVVSIGIALGAFILFAMFVVLHARVDQRMARHEALRVVNARALDRIARHWNALPEGEPPPGFDLTDHPFAVDLDLFGRASLFQWLGPAATPRGQSTLASWLTRPAARGEIADRQAAIAEVAANDQWRIVLAAHGILAAGARQHEIDSFVAWAEGPNCFGGHAATIQIAVLTIVVTLWASILLHATGVTPVALWPIPLLAGIILSFATANRIQTLLDRAGGGQDALARYAALFEHAVMTPSASPRLAALVDRMSGGSGTAPACMRRLNRILGFGELRRSAAILHFPVQALTLWDFHVAFALEHWRTANGRRVRGWLDALGELDALSLLATIQRDNPQWAVPEINPSPVLEAAAIGHPLIPDRKRVANDVTVGPPGSFALITGSNMSGKSTLLRSIGLNVVLAQAGGCVCAERFRLPECDLQTSIRVQDSLERGLSYFMAALARLKGVVDAAEQERPGRTLLFLLDEILQGTNSAERSIAVRAVTRHLLEAGASGAMTTHDLGLAEEEPIKSAATLLHFAETIEPDGTMRFDYVLKPGLATSRNALRLMQMIGIDL